MTEQLISKLPDADMQAAPAALLRAAQRARDLARETGTAIVVMRDGKLVQEAVDGPRGEERGPSAGEGC